MTYKKLAEAIEAMTDEQKEADATVYLALSDEYLPVDSEICIADDIRDVLDVGCPFLVLQDA